MTVGLVSALLIAGNVLAQAQSPTTALPEPATLQERHIEAMGGRAALKKPQARHVVGQFNVPSQGISGPLEVYAAAPNKVSTTVRLSGIGVIRSGYDGEVGWNIHPALGARLLDGLELNQMREQAEFYGLLERGKFVASMETLEETEFEGRACYKVKVTMKWGEEFVEFYDKETGLLAGNLRTQDSPMGAVEVTTVLNDYNDFGGIRLPARVTQRVLGQEQGFVVERVEYGAVDDSVFALPTEIRALTESS